MIISASRRTDIPAFYAKWFMNRIRAGFCAVPNPFNWKQISYISLKPEDVEVIVFWTRNPRPMFRYLRELDRLGYRYYFLYTVLDNPRIMDPHSPRLNASLKNFRALAHQIGPDKVIWRYDPIVFSQIVRHADWHCDAVMSGMITDAAFHRQKYKQIARAFRGHTFRSVISILSLYSKSRERLSELEKNDIEIIPRDTVPETQLARLMRHFADTAHKNNMEIHSCAEKTDLRQYGIPPGKCIDDAYIKKVFKIDVASKKDPGQRNACGCVVSRDIGMYDSCLFGCKYCYATRSFQKAGINRRKHHHPESPSLIGWYEAEPPQS